MIGPRPKDLRPTPVTVLGTLFTSVLGAVLCFLPGLDAPNYHAAFVTAVVGSLIAGPIGIFAASRALASGRDPFLGALRSTLPAALAPIVLLLLNGMRVRQCDVFSGVAFMVVGPVFSMLWAGLLGAALFCWRPRKRVAWAWFLMVFIAWAVADVVHIYRNPAIFAFNPFAGFFSGAIYDAVIVIDARIALYRLNNVAQILTIIALVRAGWDRGERRFRFGRLGEAGLSRMLPFALAAAVSFAFWVSRGAIGYEVSRADVQAELGRRLEDDRLVLVYDKSIPEAEAQALFEGHRFRLEQIEARLGRRFPRRITSYVYGNADQKRRLMGAANVYIAKPWLEEIHLNRVPFDASVIRHELAHVVLGLYADPPLHIPTSLCVIPQMALVEGAAEAFEWDTGQLTPHEWSAAMRRAQRAPDLRGLLAPEGFYGQGSDTAYTLTGSFVQWLIDEQGMAAFESIYEDGDFEGVVGRSVDALVSSWEGFLDRIDVPEDAAGLATGRFNTPAIHRRPCGLDVARVEAEAGRKRGAGDREGARADYEQVVEWIPEDAQKRRPLLDLAAQSGDLAATRRAYADYLAVPGNRNPVDDAAATELMADTIARKAIAGEAGATIEEARALYATLADVPQPEDRRRNTLVKLHLASEPTRAAKVLPYLLDGRAGSLATAQAAFPEDPLSGYLAARRLYNEGKHAEAAPALQPVIERLATVDPEREPWAPWVRREAANMRARSLYALADYEAAGDAFRFVATLTPYGGDRDRYLDWAERCAWMRTRHPKL